MASLKVEHNSLGDEISEVASSSLPDSSPAARQQGIKAIRIARVVKTTSENFIIHAQQQENLQTKSADRASKIALANHISFESSLLGDFESDFPFFAAFTKLELLSLQMT